MKRIALVTLFGISSIAQGMGGGDTLYTLLNRLGPDGLQRALGTLNRNLTPAEAAVLRAEAERQRAQSETQTAEANARHQVEHEQQETRRVQEREQQQTQRVRWQAEAAQAEAVRANAAANAAHAEQDNIRLRNQETERQRRHQAALQQEQIREARELEQRRVAENDRLEQTRDQNLRNANRLKNEGELANQRTAADHADALTRQRDADRRAAEERAQQEAIAREAQAQAERLKREQDANAVKLKQEVDAAREKAKAEAEKDKEVKEHEINMWRDGSKADVLKGKAKFEADLRKNETVAGINARITALNKAFKEFTGDPERMKSVGKFVAGTVIGTAAGVLFFKHALPIVRQAVENRLFTPVLIEESSYSIFPAWVNKLFGKKKHVEKLKNLSFDGALSEHINEIKTTLINTKKNGGFYMNYLFYGPPGTGKTAVARALAYESGMDFAFMTGGSVLDLVKSGKAIQRFNDVFDWAKKSSKGLILFIDECDAFLGDPSRMSEELNSIFKNFLNKTGTESKNFCLIFSTNHPNQLAKAILSRVGFRQQLEFAVPSVETRKKIVSHFMGTYLSKNKLVSGASSVANPAMISYIAEQTNGFAGRDLSYLILGIEKAALASEKPVVNEALVRKVVSEAVTGFNRAQHFANHG